MHFRKCCNNGYKEEIVLSEYYGVNSFSFIVYTDGQEKILVGYVGTEPEVKVPSSINNLKVIEIADEAFLNNTVVVEVKMNSNVTKIGDRAFMNCTSLKSVDAIKSVTSFGESIFEGCTSLEEISVPHSVKRY